MPLPGRLPRLLVAVSIATAAATFYVMTSRLSGQLSDFGPVWYGATALLHGADPYKLIGPGRVYVHEFPFVYPLTASVAVLPLGLLPERVAAAFFVWISSALLCFAVTSNSWHKLPLFLSTPFLIAAIQAQWSPLLAAAFCLPFLGWAFCTKPTIGLALVASSGSSRTLKVAVIGAALLSLIAFLLNPHWIAEWFGNMRSIHHLTPPIAGLGGPLVLLALLRWRRPEARLILALACVPQTVTWYDVVPLFLVPATLRESLVLALLSSAPTLYQTMFGFGDGDPGIYPRPGMLMLFAYLPALGMVLLRPNVGEPPPWISRFIEPLRFGRRRLHRRSEEEAPR